MLEQERKQREEHQRELQILSVKREADVQFAKNEEEKMQRRLQENKQTMQYLQNQMVCLN